MHLADDIRHGGAVKLHWSQCIAHVERQSSGRVESKVFCDLADYRTELAGRHVGSTVLVHVP
jgi:hypothetical protein